MLLLPGEFDRELAVANASAQAFREGGRGVLAVGRDQLGERREQARLGQTIVLDAVEARLGPCFAQIRECDLFLFVLRHRLLGRNRMHQAFHWRVHPAGAAAPLPEVATLACCGAPPRNNFRKG